MAQPIKIRDVATIRRDIRALGVLRTALRLDRSLDQKKVEAIDLAIGRLITLLLDLFNESDCRPAAADGGGDAA